MNNGLYIPPNVMSGQGMQSFNYIPNQTTSNQIPTGYSNQGSSNQIPNLIPSQSSSAPVPNMNSSQYYYNQRDYAESLFKANIGKRLEVYVSFSDSMEWRDSIFRGILEDAGRDFLLIRDEVNNKRYLLWNVYLDYVVFDEEVNLP